MAYRFAVEGEDAKKMELDVSVRIDVTLHEPRRGAPNRQPQLFEELAIQRGARRFAGLELAAGKPQ